MKPRNQEIGKHIFKFDKHQKCKNMKKENAVCDFVKYRLRNAYKENEASLPPNTFNKLFQNCSGFLRLGFISIK